MTTLLDAGYTTVLEVSPHPVLAASIAECLARAGRNGDDARRRSAARRTSATAMLRSLARALHAGACGGVGRRVRRPRGAHVQLPAYPWQRERHWFEPASVDGDDAMRRATTARREHPLLGRRVRDRAPALGIVARRRATRVISTITSSRAPCCFPAAAYVEMALGAARALRAAGARRAARARRRVQARARHRRTARPRSCSSTSTPSGVASRSSATRGRARRAWTLHADGDARRRPSDAPRVRRPRRASAHAAPARVSSETTAMRRSRARPRVRAGVPRHRARCGRETARRSASFVCRRRRGSALDAAAISVHPALLDAAFQLLIGAGGGTPASSVFDERRRQRVAPVARCASSPSHAPVGDSVLGARATGHARRRRRSKATSRSSTSTDRVLASIRGFRCKRIAGSRPRESLDHWLYEYRWERRSLGGRERALGSSSRAERSRARVQPDAPTH